MKRTILIALIFVGLAFLLLPISLDGADGHFNTITGLYWCSNRASCLHEIGHRMDWKGGWISDTPAFQAAIVPYKTPEFFYGVPNAEIYAALYAASGGDPQRLPVALRPFFTWDSPH